MATINIADKQTLDTINWKLDAVDAVRDNIYSKVDTEVNDINKSMAKEITPELSQLDRIEAALSASQEEIEQNAIDTYTLELI